MTQYKTTLSDFAILGGVPAKAAMLRVGQYHVPKWGEYEDTFRRIFERQYYTNHGPMAQELEAKLQVFCGVKHAVCVTNATIGLIMGLEALGLQGSVIVPAYTHVATVQAIIWAGLTPVLCDVDVKTHMITPDTIRPHLNKDVVAILAVNLWGQVSDIDALELFAKQHQLILLFDSAQAVGCRYKNHNPLGSSGQLEVFSMSAENVLNATQGGYITTNDDAIAAKLRNIRSSYGAGVPVDVVKTSNGRMSEAQAAFALLNLDYLSEFINHNQSIYQEYKRKISSIPGVRLLTLSHGSNYQAVVCEIDALQYGISRDALVRILRAENIQADKVNQWSLTQLPNLGNPDAQFHNTEKLQKTLIQLPCGAQVTKDDVDMICHLIEVAPQFFDGTSYKEIS